MIDDYSGEVIVDGKNINKGIKSWRKHLSYLSQNSVFLNDTIKNNITLGSDEVDDKLIKKSMEKSQILSLVNQMPLKENIILVKMLLNYQVVKNRELPWLEYFI